MELKKRQDSFNFYLLEDVNESSYSSLKKEVMDKIKEIEKVDEENLQYARSLGINVPNELKSHVKFIFHISTYGGHVYDGLGICDLLNKLDRDNNGIDVIVVCEGKIMSMGIPIILSVQNRVCSPNTTFMIHQPMSISLGKLEDLKEQTAECERLYDRIKKIIVENSRITIDMINEWDKCRADVFFDADKALEYGLIKKIV